MKFCPVCGSPMNEKLNCKNCGFEIDKKDLDGDVDKKVKEFLFTEPRLNNDEFKKRDFIKLDELIKMKLNLGGKIYSLAYSTGGGMLGGHTCIYLYFDTNTLEEVKQDTYYGPTTIKKYQIDQEKIDKIKEYITKYNFPAWSEIAQNFSQGIYNFCPTTLYFRFPNGTYEISTNTNMDQEERKIFEEFNTLVFSCMSGDKLITVEERDCASSTMMGMLDTNNQQQTNPKFCPDCGNMLENNESKCSKCNCIINR